MRDMMFDFRSEEEKGRLLKEFKEYKLETPDDLLYMLMDMDMNVGMSCYVEDESLDPEENNLSMMYREMYPDGVWEVLHMCERYEEVRNHNSHILRHLRDVSLVTLDPSIKTDLLLLQAVQTLIDRRLKEELKRLRELTK